jgi:hypothetical protein
VKTDGWIIVTDRLPAGEGRDMVTGVELFRFTDGTVSLQALLASTTHEQNNISQAFIGAPHLISSRLSDNDIFAGGPRPDHHHASFHEPAFSQIDYF